MLLTLLADASGPELAATTGPHSIFHTLEATAALARLAVAPASLGALWHSLVPGELSCDSLCDASTAASADELGQVRQVHASQSVAAE